MKRTISFIVGIMLSALVYGVSAKEATGPLKVSEINPRYFTDGTGKAIYLTGSHVWYNLVDMGLESPPPPFEFDAYLQWMKNYNHNFMRLWTWEMTIWNTEGNNPKFRKEETEFSVAPHPWIRRGLEDALDGKPLFDLTQFNPDYFDRLRERVKRANDEGMYVSVMLFEGWAMQHVENGWKYHPFNPMNNMNGINGDVNGDDKGLEVHTLANPRVTEIQERYVRKVVDTVNEFNNVLYEISNENHPASTEWQYHMIDFIHNYEKEKPKQHPVGMTFQYKGGSNETLLESPAEWISPNREGGYRTDPPVNDGTKVILLDTDHLWGIGGNSAWVWKAFTRGHNPIFMDPYDGIVLGKRFDPQWEDVRKNMGYTLDYANRMNLIRMEPRTDLAETTYCLAEPGKEYMVYFPNSEETTVNLAQAEGKQLEVEWFHPDTEKRVDEGPIDGGMLRKFKPPFDKGDAVLYLKAIEEE